jgi:hypothetical protein
LLVALLFAVGAVAAGAALALWPAGARSGVTVVRSLAVIAALAVVALHLLPHAWGAVGPAALAAFAVGALLPVVLGAATRVLGRSKAHEHGERAGIELGYAGLLVHQLGDGIGLGAIGAVGSGGWHVGAMLALAAHTVPVVALLVMRLSDLRGRAVALWRAVWLGLATALGVGASGVVTLAIFELAEAWIEAAVSGLLVHVVLHEPGHRH